MQAIKTTLRPSRACALIERRQGGGQARVCVGTIYMMNEKPFAHLDLKQAIDLRWTLRDIKAKRWVLSPINPTHLEKLIAMGLVEMRNGDPALTNSGLDVISAG
jgi:hypothetical protein